MLDVLPMRPSDIPSEVVKSPVFERTAKVNSGLVQPASAWTLLLQVMGIAVLGAVTFLTLSSNRAAVSQPLAPVVQTVAAAPIAQPVERVVEPPRPTPPLMPAALPSLPAA